MENLKILTIGIILFLLFTSIISIDKYFYNRKKKKLMKDLTGKYVHIKTPRGTIIKVKYYKDDIIKVRDATEYDITILKKYKYL
jgi:hypothetical protein